MAEFQALQRRFASHLRDPAQAPPPPGIEDRRLKIYRELFFNNVEGSLSAAFPVLRQITPEAAWQAMVRDFFARHRSHDPLFHGLAQEFLRYLETERGHVEGDPPFLIELAHYEWVELALSIADPSLDAVAFREADPLDAPLSVSPLAWTLAYSYAVHRIGPGHQPLAPPAQPTFLIVYRDWGDTVRFIEINAVTARLMERIEAEPGSTGRVHLEAMAAELGQPSGSFVAAGLEMLLGLHARQVILVAT